MSLNFYEILNVTPSSTEKEIKKAYRLLAKKYHPDTYPGDKNFAEDKMQEINVAYDTLSNAELRNAYDIKMGFNVKSTNTSTSTSTNTQTSSYYKSKYYNNTQNAYNKYNKSGVNYEVKYKPNSSRIKYDSKGYAESNYYTTKMDEDDYYSNSYKKGKFDEFISGKKLTPFTVGLMVVALMFAAYFLSEAIYSISDFIYSAQTNLQKVNSASERNQKSMRENEETVKKDIENIRGTIDSKVGNIVENTEQKIIENYRQNKNDKEKKEILESWGITDSEDQQEILEIIEQLSKN